MLSSEYYLKRIYEKLAGLATDEQGTQIAAEVYLQRIDALLEAGGDGSSKQDKDLDAVDGNIAVFDAFQTVDGGASIDDIDLRFFDLMAVSAGRDIAISDAGLTLLCSGTFTLNFPDGLPTGMWVRIVNIGTGVITLTAATLLIGDVTALKTSYSNCVVTNISANNWLALIGRGLPVDAGIVSVTSSRDLLATDAGKILECEAGPTITCPTGLPIGFQCMIVNVGTDAVTLAATGTLLSDGTLLATQYTGATVYHRGSGFWVAMGRLT